MHLHIFIVQTYYLDHYGMNYKHQDEKLIALMMSIYQFYNKYFLVHEGLF